MIFKKLKGVRLEVVKKSGSLMLHIMSHNSGKNVQGDRFKTQP